MKKPNIRFYRNKRKHQITVDGRRFNPPARGVVETLQESNRALLDKLEAQLTKKA